MSNHGGISWIGDTGAPEGHRTLSLLRFVSLTTPGLKIQNFRVSMLPHTECNSPSYIYVSTIPRTPSGPPGVAANINKKSLIYFRDPTDQKVYHFDYPSPVAADVESTPTGNIIKQSVVVDIVGYLSTVMDRALSPLYGVYLQII